MPRLRRSDLRGPGIERRRTGRGFAYRYADGQRVTDPDTLARIRALVLPPAWTDVWICPWPNGHIQAVGTDARGRRQYRYHDAWRLRRDAEKFDHMVDFARALEDLRATVDEHLAEPGLTRQRVLACSVRLLELGLFRIGSESYAEENETFGLATMRRRHVTFDGDSATFDYRGKSGKQHTQTVTDGPVVAVLRALKDRRGRGRELLGWEDEGRWVDLKSTDINQYLKEQTGRAITAKDFRTWNATVLCAVFLARCGEQAASNRQVSAAVKAVAEQLGNTPAVCRKSYIDPRIIDRASHGGCGAVAAALRRVDGEDALAIVRMVEPAVLDALGVDEERLAS